MQEDYEMAYKYQYNPAATDNVSLQDTARGRSAAGSLTYRSTNRMRRTDDDDDEVSLGTRCCFTFLYTIAQIFLNGVMALILFWICWFRWDQEKFPSSPFVWQGDTADSSDKNAALELTWNMHPFLMVAGFIYFMGQGMLVYRTGTCCRRIYTKLIHTGFHLLAIPCIAIGFVAVWDYKSLRTDETTGERREVPHFYSVHSWLGLATMGMFALQFFVGVFSFLVLLTCEHSTARFRSSLVPVHSIMGTVTFTLAVATCVCGLTEAPVFFGFIKYLFGYQGQSINSTSYLSYINNLEGIQIQDSEPLFLNVISAGLGALAIIMPLILWYPKFRFRSDVA